jgi:hypothetical protein
LRGDFEISILNLKELQTKPYDQHTFNMIKIKPLPKS